MARKMGLDLGNVNIGIAFSDPLAMFASGFINYRRQSLEQDLQYIADLAAEKQVDTIVVGLPKNMDGTEGERVEFTYSFCDELKKYVEDKGYKYFSVSASMNKGISDVLNFTANKY